MKYKSSVLKCDVGDCDCPICMFLHDQLDTATLLRVIEVLDEHLADSEKYAHSLLITLSAKIDPTNGLYHDQD